MESKVMGKTLAIFMVIAMITTGIAMLPGSTQAAGACTVSGQLKDDVTDANVGGVKVTITNATLSINKNVTSTSDGKFSVSVSQRGNYTLTFEKSTYRTKTTTLLNTTFVVVSNVTTANIGIQLLEPLPTVSGTIKELGSSALINDVEVTIKDGTSGVVLDQIKTVNGLFSAPVDTLLVDIYYKKNGYYDNNDEDVIIAAYGVTNVGTVFLEKIVPTPTIKVWGIVFADDGTDATLSGAIISISAGDEKWITSVSDDVGYFEMLAYPGNFQIKGALTGYSNYNPTWFNVPSDKSVRKDIYLEKTPAETQTIDGTIFMIDGITPIVGADIYLHSTDGKYLNHTVSNGTGVYVMKFYPPTGTVSFVLEVKKDNFFTNAATTGITATAHDKNVTLNAITLAHKVSGFISDLEDEKPLTNATVTIYSKDYLYTQTTKTIASGYYEFNVHNNSDFSVVVDAEGYQSEMKPADGIIADRYLEVGLHKSGSDIAKTTYTFVDWSRIQVTKKSIISVDNVTVRLNADRKFGMGDVGLVLNDGTLSPAEVQLWADYLVSKGAEKRDTKEFLTVNNTYYKLNTTNYGVSIQGAAGSVSDYSTIYINSTYNYTLTGEMTAPGTIKDPKSNIYTLVLNATYDTEFVDYTNDIILPITPRKFEMTRNITETNNVEVLGYNNPITVNPEIFTEDMEKVTMTIQLSRNGTANVKVLSGVYYVLNYTNYSVIVPMGPSAGTDTSITFSAEESTDKIGDISKANFTWNFGDLNNTVGYGIEAKHNFTSKDGELVVRLVITETGGNKTWRNTTVFVDSQNPNANISAVTTDSDNISYAPNILTVNEDLPVTFSGIRFTDAYGMSAETIDGLNSTDAITSGDGGEGIIEKWYWSWGEDDVSDETITKDGSNNITHTYNTPGTYTLNMIATDVVGRESKNATWTINVLDITAPVADFNIRNAAKTIVSEVIENKTFQYNASTTIDNLDELANLTFQWFFKIGSTTTSFNGTAIDYTFAKVGDFNVTLVATDKSGNHMNKTTLVHVNLAERPNILMKLGSMVFGAKTGTAGKAMTISVNITNDGKANATDIQTKFYIRNADGTDKEIGTTTTAFLGIGNTTSVSISWTPGKKGEFSIWANSTCAGEHSSQWWDNKIDDFSIQKITVKEAVWVMPAIIIGIVVVIVVVFFGMRYFMKSGTEKEATGEKRKKR
jgi:hypothetical protein